MAPGKVILGLVRFAVVVVAAAASVGRRGKRLSDRVSVVHHV